MLRTRIPIASSCTFKSKLDFLPWLVAVAFSFHNPHFYFVRRVSTFVAFASLSFSSSRNLGVWALEFHFNVFVWSVVNSCSCIVRVVLVLCLSFVFHFIFRIWISQVEFAKSQPHSHRQDRTHCCASHLEVRTWESRVCCIACCCVLHFVRVRCIYKFTNCVIFASRVVGFFGYSVRFSFECKPKTNKCEKILTRILKILPCSQWIISVSATVLSGSEVVSLLETGHFAAFERELCYWSVWGELAFSNFQCSRNYDVYENCCAGSQYS